MEVYLDNCATTRPRDEVIEKMVYVLKNSYGNPSSLHKKGFEAEKMIEESRDIIAKFLNVEKEEIFFTSGGTESNNLAIQGIVNKCKRQGRHIITTKIEHASVLNIFKYYESQGYEITYLDVDDKGRIDLDQFEKSIKDDTILIAIMLVNNEIGTIEPIREIRKIINSKNKNIKVHVDGIQAFGKIPLNISKLGIDTFSFSSHKVFGPKGVGGLYVKRNLNINPIIFGGNQEKGLRSGTENVPGIVGFGKAVEILKSNFDVEIKKIYYLRNYFADKIKHSIDNIKINTELNEDFAPHILNVSFRGVRGEVLLHYLEQYGIYVSTASACSSHGKGKSHVLKAIGLSESDIDGTIRFSFSHYINENQLDYTVDKLISSVKEIREITMR